MKNRIASSLLCLIFAATAWSQAPTVINATDLLVNSRTTLNTNFLNLYNGSSGLIDCSATPGAFVVTLNGAGSAPVCRTLTWTIISTLTGFPSSFVNSWNSRTGAVTLQSSDVAAVEQDLRNSASPNFNGLNLGGALAVTGASAFTGNVTMAGTLAVTGTLTAAGCSGCGGVTSFNTRTGAVTLTKADVTAVDQALGTGDSPTFAGLTLSGLTSTYVPYSASGVLTGNSNFTFDSSTGALSAVDFDCVATGSTYCVQQTSGTFTITGAGNAAFQSVASTKGFTGVPAAFSTYASCGSGTKGTAVTVTDSTTQTWGATVTGSGSYVVLMFCDGTNWTVAAK